MSDTNEPEKFEDAFDYTGYTPPILPWLREIINRVVPCCICPAYGRMTGFDLELFNDESMTDDGAYPLVVIAPSLGEIAGGKSDGQEIFDLVDINLLKLLQVFDTTDPEFSFSYVPSGRSKLPGTKVSPAHIAVYTSKLAVLIYFQPLPEARSAWTFDTKVGGWRMRDVDETDS